MTNSRRMFQMWTLDDAIVWTALELVLFQQIVLK